VANRSSSFDAVGGLFAGTPRVLLVGAAPDAEAIFATLPCTTSRADNADAISVLAALPIDLVIVDASRWASAAWVEARSVLDLDVVPVLLLEGDGAEGPEVFGAIDSVPRPLTTQVIDRRIKVLVELGRARRNKAPSFDDPPRFFDSLLEDLPSGVLTADRQGRVTFVNKNGLRTLGSEDLEWRGRSMADVLRLPGELTLGNDRRRFTYPYEIDRRRLDLGVTVSPAPGVHPDLHWFVMFRDLTANREEELAHQRTERLAAIGTMVAGFAHEVRNPVSAMRSLIEGLYEEIPEPDPRRNLLARLVRHLERIERLVQRSLKFGRPVEPMKAPIGAKLLIDGALEDTRNKLRGLEIQHEETPDLPLLLVDESMIVQALVAVINNAIEASKGVGRIDLKVDRYLTVGGERGVSIAVTDNGPGIADHVMGHIFDPFFTTKAEGTGLGLSIAQRLVHDNGGRLEVTSPRGQGCVCTIYLPVKSEPA
jgi:signal transduction histidine kinase